MFESAQSTESFGPDHMMAEIRRRLSNYLTPEERATFDPPQSSVDTAHEFDDILARLVAENGGGTEGRSIASLEPASAVGLEQEIFNAIQEESDFDGTVHERAMKLADLVAQNQAQKVIPRDHGIINLKNLQDLLVNDPSDNAYKLAYLAAYPTILAILRGRSETELN